MRLLIVAGMLTLTVSASVTPANAKGGGPAFPRHEEACDQWGPGWRYTILCHCSFECGRQYSYTVRLPCSPGMPGYVSGMKGLCDRRVYPVETTAACMRTCVKAKRGTYP
jgi:hypothetical protein